MVVDEQFLWLEPDENEDDDRDQGDATDDEDPPAPSARTMQ
jgi:hypothetical protein